jgi:methyltransferase
MGASWPALAFIGFVIAQRLIELVIARRNTSRLLERGGREVGGEHYPLIVALHAAWIVSLVVFGWQSALVLPWLGVYAVLQVFRVWILASLGPRWTTRIIIIDEPLVRRGPYRFFPHPNYLLVVAELIAVPMCLGLPLVALAFTILNALVLTIRISAENNALRQVDRSSFPSG